MWNGGVYIHTMDFLAVALGGALGSMLRFATQNVFRTWFAAGFPWGTLAVNLVGSFLIGVCAAVAERGWPGVRPWIITGFLGGFTTFSAFSFESFHLIRNGQALAFLLNILVSVAGGIFLAYAGYALARS